MAGIIQEGLEIKGKDSIQVNKGGSKIICLSNREDSIPVGVGAYGNSKFSWIQEPVPLSWDMTSGLRQLLLTPLSSGVSVQGERQGSCSMPY